jgi:hypothetical protein
MNTEDAILVGRVPRSRTKPATTKSQQVHFLHLLLSIFAVENSRAWLKCVFRERNGSRRNEGNEMRIVETVTAGLVALTAQVLVVATVFM